MKTIKSLVSILGTNGLSSEEVKGGKVGKRTHTSKDRRKRTTKTEDLSESMREIENLDVNGKDGEQ